MGSLIHPGTMIGVRRVLLPLLLVALASALLTEPAAAVPLIPHRFLGDVSIAGQPAANGIAVSAAIGGVTYASAATAYGTNCTPAPCRYGDVEVFTVPGDDPGTTPKEGGVPGDTVVFYVDRAIAGADVWAQGASSRLDLVVPATAALSVTLSLTPNSPAVGASVIAQGAVRSLAGAGAFRAPPCLSPGASSVASLGDGSYLSGHTYTSAASHVVSAAATRDGFVGASASTDVAIGGVAATGGGGGGGGAPVGGPPTAESVGELGDEDAADFVEVLPTELAAEIVADLPADQAGRIVDLLSAEKATAVLAEIDASKAAAILEGTSSARAAELLEGMEDTRAALIVEGLSATKAGELLAATTVSRATRILEGITAAKAADVLVQLTVNRATEIIEGADRDKAAAILAAVETASAAVILDQVTTTTTSALLERMPAVTAGRVMNLLTTQKIEGVVGLMSAEKLAERLPEVEPEKLFQLSRELLFARLPSVPVEQLAFEVSPVVDPDLPSPEGVQVSPTLAVYRVPQTRELAWAKLVGSPVPIESILGRFTRASTEVSISVEDVDALPGRASPRYPRGARSTASSA